MNAQRNCPSCFRPIPLDAPQGVCPSCMFGLLKANPDRATQPKSESEDQAPDFQKLVMAFPQLEIGDRAGAGGMGHVYRARQRHLDRQVALKILNPRLAADSNFQERFAREARLMARLIHPNIALVFEFGQAGEFNYLLMELIDGVSLRSAIRNKTITPEQAMQIVPQLCDALQYAHEQGVIHRDIKPENILLDKTGRVKLVDFGLAKLNQSAVDQVSLTGSQQVMGTMNYMAPEVWERDGQVDHRADIFSLGVVFYELLTGELPLGRFAPPSQRAAVDQRLDSIVMRTLEKDPGARFQSAGEVKTAVSASWNLPQPQHYPSAPRESDELVAGVPITMGDNMDKWETNGMVSLYQNRLRIEYSRKDAWFGTDKGIRDVEIPIRDIARVRLLNGPMTKGIEIQTKSLTSLKDFPYVSDRGVVIYTRRGDNSLRDQLFREIARLIGQPEPGHYDGVRDMDAAKALVRWPANGLIFAGAVDLLFAGGGLAYLIYSARISEVGTTEVAALVPTITLSALMAPFLVWIGFILLSFRNFAFCLTGCILAMLPIHLGFLVGIPSGIFGLIAISRQIVYSAFETSALQRSKWKKPG